MSGGVRRKSPKSPTTVKMVVREVTKWLGEEDHAWPLLRATRKMQGGVNLGKVFFKRIPSVAAGSGSVRRAALALFEREGRKVEGGVPNRRPELDLTNNETILPSGGQLNPSLQDNPPGNKLK
eukprot:Hpha_TRINITY_DN15447_c0_g1::TRINITY_DN15447_c0_g1_i2::g.175374::m.175374